MPSYTIDSQTQSWPPGLALELSRRLENAIKARRTTLRLELQAQAREKLQNGSPKRAHEDSLHQRVPYLLQQPLAVSSAHSSFPGRWDVARMLAFFAPATRIVRVTVWNMPNSCSARSNGSKVTLRLHLSLPRRPPRPAAVARVKQESAENNLVSPVRVFRLETRSCRIEELRLPPHLLRPRLRHLRLQDLLSP